jgi:hypothetical protein
VNVWVIGCGKFGSKAVTQLLRSAPDVSITVADPNPEKLVPWDGRVEIVIGDGIEFMTRHLKAEPWPEWIIPAAPVHVAYRWILENASGVRLETIPVPEPFVPALPNPFRGKAGELFLSFADFLCPEDCPEPADTCTVTGHPRKENLYTLLENLSRFGWPSVVIRSRLLFPGVGGYPPRALYEMKNRIENIEGTFLLSTACRCHGVLHALKAGRIAFSESELQV